MLINYKQKKTVWNGTSVGNLFVTLRSASEWRIEPETSFIQSSNGDTRFYDGSNSFITLAGFVPNYTVSDSSILN
jgi:hypothetical protein